MIVAYLILAHDQPGRLERLVGRLPPDSPILIHFDRRGRAEDWARVQAFAARVPNVVLTARHRCQWGNYGIIAATLELIRGLVRSGQPFDYAMLLSGADYPIKSNARIAKYLGQHDGDEFIESFSLSAPNRWTQDEGLYGTPGKVLRRHLWFRSRVYRLPGRPRRLPLGMTPFGGAQWWCLTSGAIRHIVRFTHDHPEVERFFRWSFIPDESFIQTVVSNSPFADRITGDDLRLAIWNRPDPPYPAVLKAADLSALLGSHKLFARKFDPQADGEIFDLLDKQAYSD